MIEITFQDINVLKLGHTSGIFIGDKNSFEKFRHEKIINEVVGTLSGNENAVKESHWMTNMDQWVDH